MSELTPAVLAEFKKKLQDSLEETRVKHADIQADLRDHKEVAADPMDQATKMSERNEMLAQSSYLASRIQQIAKTLNNFEDYGFCMECGEDIPFQRLEIEPATIFCIHCKEVQEMTDARTRAHMS